MIHDEESTAYDPQCTTHESWTMIYSESADFIASSSSDQIILLLHVRYARHSIVAQEDRQKQKEGRRNLVRVSVRLTVLVATKL